VRRFTSLIVGHAIYLPQYRSVAGAVQRITDCCGKLRLFFLGENRSSWIISRSHTGRNSLSPYAENQNEALRFFCCFFLIF